MDPDFISKETATIKIFIVFSQRGKKGEFPLDCLGPEILNILPG
jgi:hypothetical protein